MKTPEEVQVIVDKLRETKKSTIEIMVAPYEEQIKNLIVLSIIEAFEWLLTGNTKSKTIIELFNLRPKQFKLDEE